MQVIKTELSTETATVADHDYDVWPGDPYPLGATWDGEGTNFALFSAGADRVALCLFDSEGNETARIPLLEQNNQVWHSYLPGVHPGQRYGYRVYGRYAPEQGLRFNPNKLLLDPYAKAIDGDLVWDDALFGYIIGHEDADLSFDERDSAPFMPKGVVLDTGFEWGDDHHPRTPLHETIIYEAHVKGQTILHPDVPDGLRGTYAGLAHPAMITYLKDLGITAVELMPVHQFINQRILEDKGLSNYWGYDSIAYFAPHGAYASADDAGEQVREFKGLVKALHAAGIEVILDVVYNHTAEGNHLGPTLSFRGIDNGAYYRLVAGNPRYYMDYTGTGNTLNMVQPHVLQLIMDSLRYWVTEMHVDGFRFDLAAALARELHDVSQLSAFFDIIHQDPIISQIKLIAEPWDVGEGGYMVGAFPPGWAEWNGKYRDTMRDYWRGEPGTLSEFAYRFTGSSDLYDVGGRRPTASINFITAHDGYTLADLVSYHERHNEANLEGDSGGHSDNRSWNCGAEGLSDDPGVNTCRDRQKRNFLTTLFLSQGVPMLLAGDEIGRTQQGNNNAYSQDNEISWLNWASADEKLLAFTQQLLHFRRAHLVFRQRRWFSDLPVPGSDASDIAWFTPGAKEMQDEFWRTGFARSLGIFLNGRGIKSLGRHGNRVVDDSFYLMFNAHYEPLPFKLPDASWSRCWVKVIDTAADPAIFRNENEQLTQEEYPGGAELMLASRSIVVLRHVD